VVRTHSPSTKDWFEGVTEEAPKAGQDALYNEVRKFFQTAPQQK